MNLKNYKSILTDDGSQTLYSKRYQEACHSTHGAAEETRLHYIQGCDLENKLIKNQVARILEVGFGTGIGLKETLHASQSLGQIEFVSFEIDPELIEYSLREYKWQHTNQFNNDMDYFVEIEDAKIFVIVGDARKRIKDLQAKIKDETQNPFDVVYQDAFSPRRNADLWTKEWFEDLKLVCGKDVRLSTYSASSSIRKAMVAAGWAIHPGAKFGPKRTSTRASLSGQTDPEIMERLERSPAIVLNDQNFQEYMNEKNKNK